LEENNNLTALETAIKGGNTEIIGLIQALKNNVEVPNIRLKQTIVSSQYSAVPVTTPNVSDTRPLPPGLEKRVAPNGKVYYVDHNTSSTSWVHPDLLHPSSNTTIVPISPFSPSLPFNQKKQSRRIFISYCWKNSKQADISCVGKTDPRVLSKALEDIMKEKCWLDIDVANGGHPLFDAIAMGIYQAEVFIVCISDEYVQSKTCEQELTYASKTCKKRIIPVVVGETMNWQFSGCGFLLSTELYIDFRDLLKFNSNMDILVGRLQKILSI